MRKLLVTAVVALGAAACGGSPQPQPAAAASPPSARAIAAKLHCTGIAPDTLDRGLSYTAGAITCSEPGAARYMTDTILTFRTRTDEQAWANDPDNGGSAVVGPLWIVVPSAADGGYPHWEPWSANVVRVLGGRPESLGG